jgi:uncharacterized peroxidase-related enzyme
MMAFIDTVPVGESTGEVRAMYERSQTDVGYVPNYAKLFSHRPPVMAAWGALLGSIRQNLDPRRYELVTVAAARALGSSYCALVHGRILRDRFYTGPELAAIVDGAGPLTPAERALMAFAERVARQAGSITAADVQTLREHGLAEAEIFDVAAAVAARCFFSTLLDALGAEPDAPYAAVEDGLRQRLEVGRTIATMPPEPLPPPSAAPET